jgi:hypothetical protein
MLDDFYLHPFSLPPRPNLEQSKKLAKRKVLSTCPGVITGNP